MSDKNDPIHAVFCLPTAYYNTKTPAFIDQSEDEYVTS